MTRLNSSSWPANSIDVGFRLWTADRTTGLRSGEFSAVALLPVARREPMQNGRER